MKLKNFLVAVLAVFVLEISAAAIFLSISPKGELDIIQVNDVTQSVSMNFYDLQNSNLPRELDYVVVDREEKVLFSTKQNLSKSINDAIKNRDTIIEVTVEGHNVGKIFINNNSSQVFIKQRNMTFTFLIAAICAQGLLFGGYVLYLNRVMVKPFAKLKSFAIRVASGDFDVPLKMDRKNMFGAFTESFDIMRHELIKSRESEAAANLGKKELVAKLSHDIKTPIASIKSLAELGAVTEASKVAVGQFKTIESKADQINVLVSNLFQASLEELQQLTVAPTDNESLRLTQMIKNSDYLGRASIDTMPECLLYFDAIRLQQVLDNIISNSYKYAGTDIKATAAILGNFCEVSIEDYGGGVLEEELPIILGKFKRGANVAGKDGAGLGLYISDYLMRQMGGTLNLQNTEKGFKATLCIKVSGK